ncbi:MAG: LacI family transcriptional regulator [Treponema sp.]|jgi:LacI family transcriptional regulator|nr:LacI family transcriptional regulator [Treponema sp.]
MKDRSVTIRDVAAAAGVSTATVSRTLDPESAGGVSEKTRLRVVTAVTNIGYRLNLAARSLKTRSTRTVAIIAPELANNFFMDLAESIEKELSAQGYTLLVASSENSVEEEKKRVTLLADRMVDGMLVIPAGSQGDHLSPSRTGGIPVVLIDRLVEGTKLDAVVSDNEAGARALTKKLLEDGFSRIAFVGGDKNISTADERISGFKAAMGEAGIQVNKNLLRLKGMKTDDGFAHMDAILKSDKPPEAMVAVNLLVHLGMELCILARLPHKQRSYLPVIAAFDQSDYSPFLPACRYTAAQDAAAIGKAAARLILERIGQRKKRDEGARESVPQKDSIQTEITEPQIIRFPVMIMRHFQNR